MDVVKQGSKKKIDPNELMARARAASTTKMFYEPPTPISPSQHWEYRALKTDSPFKKAIYGVLAGVSDTGELFLNPIGSAVTGAIGIYTLARSPAARKGFLTQVATPFGATRLVTGLMLPAAGAGVLARMSRVTKVGEYSGLMGKVSLNKGKMGVMRVARTVLPEKKITTMVIETEKGEPLFRQMIVSTPREKIISMENHPPVINKFSLMKAEKTIFGYKGKPKLLEEHKPEVKVSMFGIGKDRLIIHEMGEYKPTGMIKPEQVVNKGKIEVGLTETGRKIIAENPLKGKRVVIIKEDSKIATMIERPQEPTRLDKLIGHKETLYDKKILIKKLETTKPETRQFKSTGIRQLKKIVDKQEPEKTTMISRITGMKNILKEKPANIEKIIGKTKPQEYYKTSQLTKTIIGTDHMIRTTAAATGILTALSLGKQTTKQKTRTIITSPTPKTTNILGLKTMSHPRTCRWIEPIPDIKSITKTRQTAQSTFLDVIPRPIPRPAPPGIIPRFIKKPKPKPKPHEIIRKRQGSKHKPKESSGEKQVPENKHGNKQKVITINKQQTVNKTTRKQTQSTVAQDLFRDKEETRSETRRKLRIIRSRPTDKNKSILNIKDPLGFWDKWTSNYNVRFITEVLGHKQKNKKII